MAMVRYLLYKIVMNISLAPWLYLVPGCAPVHRVYLAVQEHSTDTGTEQLGTAAHPA